MRLGWVASFTHPISRRPRTPGHHLTRLIPPLTLAEAAVLYVTLFGSSRSCSRSLLRWTFPVAVRGRSCAISTRPAEAAKDKMDIRIKGWDDGRMCHDALTEI